MSSSMETFEVDSNSKEEALLVRFSTGKLKPQTKKGVKFKVYGKRKVEGENTHHQMEVTTDVNGIKYCGRNYGASNFFKTDTCDYYLGICQHGSGKVRVVPAHLFQLEPQFAGKAEIVPKTPGDKPSFFEQREELIKQFGSGKMQKMLKKQEKEKLDKDMIAETTESIVKKVFNDETTPRNKRYGNDNTQSVDAALSYSFLPPHDRNAETIADFYKLDNILPLDIRENLKLDAAQFEACTATTISTWRTEEKYFHTVLGILEKCLNVQGDVRSTRSQCLIYLQYLMVLYKKKYQDLRLKDPLPLSWNSKIKDHLLSSFTLFSESAKRRVRCAPPRMKNLQMSYIMVLCLLLNNYDIDLTCLAADLKMPVKQLQTHASALGCKISMKESNCIATLTFPVKFPEMKGKLAKNRIF